jgi:hypothetical protein
VSALPAGNAATELRIKAVRDGHARGWSFTPLSGKVPVLRGWQSAPREELARAVAWGQAGNIGIRCGPSGLVILDGLTEEIPEELSAVETPIVRTGRSWHLYFAAPADIDIGCATRHDLPGVDCVKGAGGQAVFVGSVHPETQSVYRWAEGFGPDDVPLAPLPTWIIERLRQPPGVQHVQPHHKGTRTRQPLLDAAARYVGAAQAAGEPGRNTATFRLAGHLYAFDHDGDRLTEAEAVELMRGWNVRNSPPLPDGELRKAVASAFQGNGTPRAPHLVQDARRAVAKAQQQPVRPARLRLVCAADIEPEATSWIWWHRFPAAKLSILAGMQGIGKGFASIDMAARISRGAAWPDLPDATPPRSGSVIMLAAEDGLADTLIPRLRNAGAALDNVAIVQAVEDVDGTGPRGFNLARDLHLLERQIELLGDARLLIIDPLNSYCGAVDGNSDTEIRAVLQPLADLAQRTGVAVLAVAHLTKTLHPQALYRVLGSVAYTALARAVWMIGQDREDPKRLLLLPAKLNIAKPAPGLAFRIETPSGGIPDVGAVTWEPGEVAQTADEVFGPEERPTRGPAWAQAAEWLREQLADAGGAMLARDVLAARAQSGPSESALRDARTRMRLVVARATGVPNGPWIWAVDQAHFNAAANALKPEDGDTAPIPKPSPPSPPSTEA